MEEKPERYSLEQTHPYAIGRLTAESLFLHQRMARVSFISAAIAPQARGMIRMMAKCFIMTWQQGQTVSSGVKISNES